MNIEKTISALEKNRYAVKYFETSKAATEYLASLFNGEYLGFGDSDTMVKMGLYEKLSQNNKVVDPKQSIDNDSFLEIAREALTTDYYLTSVNAMSEEGHLVNIDGTGNRVAGSLFGHKKVYFIVGTNKIEPDLDKAVWRARNIAAPKNASRYELKTPCAIKGDKCYNCSSPDRICNGLMIYLKKMNDIDMEVILINENLGY